MSKQLGNKVLTCKLGYPVTVGGQCLNFIHTTQNKLDMHWYQGLLTITTVSGDQIVVPAGNIAFMSFAKETE